MPSSPQSVEPECCFYSRNRVYQVTQVTHPCESALGRRFQAISSRRDRYGRFGRAERALTHFAATPPPHDCGIRSRLVNLGWLVAPRTAHNSPRGLWFPVVSNAGGVPTGAVCKLLDLGGQNGPSRSRVARMRAMPPQEHLQGLLSPSGEQQRNATQLRGSHPSLPARICLRAPSEFLVLSSSPSGRD